MRLTPKIGWILTGDYSLASSRLQGFRIHEHLTLKGYRSSIVATDFWKLEGGLSPRFFSLARTILKEGFDIVFFQKPGWMMFKMSELLRLNGVRTAAIQCDPFTGPYAGYFDATVVTTAALREQLNLPFATVIDDMLEVPPACHKKCYGRSSPRLRVVWVGQGTGPGGRDFILPFLATLAQSERLKDKVELVTISRGDWATHQWSLDTVYSRICNCDAAIIPLPEDGRAGSKSSNRLTMFMALGMPVIASPIDSYLRIAFRGENCLIAHTLEGFVDAIAQCESEVLRARVGENARKFARENFAPEVIGQQWCNLADALFRAGTPPSFPNNRVKIIDLLAARTLRLLAAL